jgi:hypothetical protein
VDEKLMATKVTEYTLVGSWGDFPRKQGNCFSVLASDGKCYRIVNFLHENLEQLNALGIVFPVQIRALSDGVAVIHDSRIPDEWYSSRFCEMCCPDSLLPLPQLLAHARQEACGYRTVGKGLVWYDTSKRPVLVTPNVGAKLETTAAPK